MTGPKGQKVSKPLPINKQPASISENWIGRSLTSLAQARVIGLKRVPACAAASWFPFTSPFTLNEAQTLAH
jgi:hypothetical protein